MINEESVCPVIGIRKGRECQRCTWGLRGGLAPGPHGGTLLGSASFHTLNLGLPLNPLIPLCHLSLNLVFPKAVGDSVQA